MLEIVLLLNAVKLLTLFTSEPPNRRSGGSVVHGRNETRAVVLRRKSQWNNASENLVGCNARHLVLDSILDKTLKPIEGVL